MPHQCVKCGKIYVKASQDILTGCSECGGKFFFYIKEEQLAKLKEEPIVLQAAEKEQIEKDVREMVGAVDEESPARECPLHAVFCSLTSLLKRNPRRMPM